MQEKKHKINLTDCKEGTHDEARSPYMTVIRKQEQPDVGEHKVFCKEIESFKQFEHSLLGVGGEVTRGVVSLCDRTKQDTNNT